MPKKASLLKEVGIVVAGGFAEIFTEIAVDTFATANPVAGKINTGDLVGAMEATLITVFGYKKNNYNMLLLGAGGLAVATPNIVGKMVM